jgi:hypothetical protein
MWKWETFCLPQHLHLSERLTNKVWMCAYALFNIGDQMTGFIKKHSLFFLIVLYKKHLFVDTPSEGMSLRFFSSFVF